MPARHANNWDDRYDHQRFFYGTGPNYLVARELPALPPGRLLCLAEGEGRNAVFAAGLGHRVTAVDSSAVGRRKALALAAAEEVELDYRCEDVGASAWDKKAWDAVVMCFAHLDPLIMGEVHRRVAACLAPGGRLLHVSFSKAQFGRPSGGPPRLDWLHELEVLQEQYAGLRWERAVELEVDLAEGSGHRGPALVVELLGVKPA